MHIFSVLLTGHPFLHSCLHLFGLHFSGLTIAILCLSSMVFVELKIIFKNEFFD